MLFRFMILYSYNLYNKYIIWAEKNIVKFQNKLYVTEKEVQHKDQT